MCKFLYLCVSLHIYIDMYMYMHVFWFAVLDLGEHGRQKEATAECKQSLSSLAACRQPRPPRSRSRLGAALPKDRMNIRILQTICVCI